LRWIVACCPEEEDGWLALARLLGDSQEQIPVLKSAYRFHPESQRVQAALREARQRQLASAVGELKSRRTVPRCLPDERQLAHRAHGPSGNGRGPAAGNGHHPLRKTSSRRLWRFPFLARLLPREPSALRNGKANGQSREISTRGDTSPY